MFRTDAALENLLGFRPKTIVASGHFVWTLSPAERILQRMERQPDAATLSAPRVITTNARQAQMAVDGIQPFLHSRAHTSAACQVIPYQIGSSLDLAVAVKITESGDVGPAFGDDLSGNPKEDTNDASSGAKSNQVYAVNAVGYVNLASHEMCRCLCKLFGSVRCRRRLTFTTARLSCWQTRK